MATSPSELLLTAPYDSYNWQRLLVLRGADVDLTDAGFLRDSGDWFSSSRQSPAFPPSEVAGQGCVIILGEHGIGKSDVMRGLATAAARDPAADMQWVDLSGIGSDALFVAQVFEGSQFRAWLQGEHRLSLFFDSFDEGLMRVAHLANLLRTWLSQYRAHLPRLSLRIACRTSDWSGESFERALGAIWQGDHYGMYQVAPLRRVDVITAATAEGIEPYAFLGEVFRTGAVSLAIRPLTLKLLLNTYRGSGGHLPDARHAIYRDGIVELCTERGQGRRESHQTGQLLPQQRMAVAARIAYLMAFTNTSTIRTAPPIGDLADGEIAKDDLSSGEEVANTSHTDTFAVTEAAITETLGTGLFASHGPDRLGWAHRNYRDFLAAWYVGRSRIGTDQRIALLQHPDDPHGKVAPSLRPVAAWLAGTDGEVFRRVLDADCMVLLDTDMTSVSEQDRAALVARLLDEPDKARLVHDTYVAGSLPNLSHPRLVEQLHTALTSHGDNSDTKCLIANIARDSDAGDFLRGELADVALDELQPLAVRKQAAYAIATGSDAAAHARLRPLAIAPDASDVDDELKGYALRACWPAHLDVSELFVALSPPRVQNIVGAYKGFLCTDFLRHVPDNTLPVALTWIPQGVGEYFLDRVADQILWRALPLLNREGMARTFASAFLARLHVTHRLMSEHGAERRFAAALQEAVQGRRLVAALLPLGAERGENTARLVRGRVPLVFPEDIRWLIEQVRQADDATRDLWVNLLQDLSWHLDSEGWGEVFDACESVSAIRTAFAASFDPVLLDSPQADEMRAAHATWEEHEATLAAMEAPLPPTPNLDARLAPLLARSEAGESGMWPAICEELLHDGDGNFAHGHLFTVGLQSHPNWEESDDATKGRLFAAAQRYIAAYAPTPTQWLTRSSYRHFDLEGDWAGLQALVLLTPAEQAHIAPFLAPFLPQWVPVIVGYPYIINDDPIAAIRHIVCAAYSYAPDAVIAALCDRIRQQAEQQIHVTVLPLIEGCWDDCIAAAVFALARNPTLAPRAMEQLIEALLARQAPDAIPFLESLVGLPLPTDERERCRSVVAAHLLVRHVPASWPHVWAAIQTDDAYGRELINAMIGSDHWTATSVYDLPADALADLYLWLVARFPHGENPADDGNIVRNATTHDFRGWWRDSIVTFLRDRATPDAVAALRRIGDAMPQLSWVRVTIAQVEEAMREATWHPLYTPEQLLRLARDRNLRAAQNGDQLLVVVAESLVRLDREVLHGQTPQVRLLWNDLGNGQWRPKDEATLSDYVKVHLERELNDVIVNREVQIHFGNDRLDILVDAIQRDATSGRVHRISVVVEVKGGWNAERWIATRTQLAERYLTDSAIHHGIYLVGWYICDEWDRNDPRFGMHPKEGGIEATRTRLESDATELLNDNQQVRALVIDVSLGAYTSARHPRRSSTVDRLLP